MSANTTNLAILFADVVGSTALYNNYGDHLALTSINGCIGLLRKVTSEFNGRVIKTIGDEVMAVFDSAENAFCASSEMQWRVRDLPPCGSHKIAIRIGFHFGQTLLQDGDVFGDSVNLAARLAELARPSQILTSGQTFDAIGKPQSNHLRRLNGLTVRGMDSSETIYEGLWQEDENMTTLLSGLRAEPRNALVAEFKYADVKVDFGPQCKSITFGRDPENTVIVSNRKASRLHARIERRRDKLMLIDQSANGTFVTDGSGLDTVLRLEEMALRGCGLVSFGEPVGANHEGLLEYTLDDDTSAASDSFLVAAR